MILNESNFLFILHGAGIVYSQSYALHTVLRDAVG